MPSVSYRQWSTVRAAALDELEHAHQSVGGVGRGRRYATQQINQAYAVLLSSQFQGFCRDLHTECAQILAAVIQPAALQQPIRAALTQDRKLDRGNPNAGNIGSDFGRLGLEFWTDVRAVHVHNTGRQALLDALNIWRNAIAHQDFDPAKLGSRTTLTVADVRRWRSACNGLAQSFDLVMRSHLRSLTGTAPW